MNWRLGRWRGKTNEPNQRKGLRIRRQIPKNDEKERMDEFGRKRNKCIGI
jgi:hypothetical protein